MTRIPEEESNNNGAPYKLAVLIKPFIIGSIAVLSFGLVRSYYVYTEYRALEHGLKTQIELAAKSSSPAAAASVIDAALDALEQSALGQRSLGEGRDSYSLLNTLRVPPDKALGELHKELAGIQGGLRSAPVADASAAELNALEDEIYLVYSDYFEPSARLNSVAYKQASHSTVLLVMLISGLYIILFLSDILEKN